MSDPLLLRTTFDEDAELYNRARPRYSEALFDTLVAVTHLSANAQLLEIGPGTGQATRPLAARGYSITAVELGSRLAAVARRELCAYPNVQIITGAFEETELPGAHYDLIYVATAFHWIRPEAKYRKPYLLLKSNGCLAIIRTEHVSNEMGDAFFRASQPIYDTYTPKTDDGLVRLPRLDDLQPDDIDTSLFEPVYFKVFPVTQHYTAEQYTSLLSTYSGQRAMPSPQRQAFLRDIAQLITGKFNGSIERRFGLTLTVARRR